MAMNPPSITEPNQAQVMLEAFKKHTVQKLYEAMLEDIKPKLREAAEAAGRELEATLRVMHDRDKDRIVVLINTEKQDGRA
jgi:23S rRNA-/tRNA-specific pseudouridylate synthase